MGILPLLSTHRDMIACLWLEWTSLLFEEDETKKKINAHTENKKWNVKFEFSILFTFTKCVLRIHASMQMCVQWTKLFGWTVYYCVERQQDKNYICIRRCRLLNEWISFRLVSLRPSDWWKKKIQLKCKIACLAYDWYVCVVVS